MANDKDREHQSHDITFKVFDVGTGDNTIVAVRNNGANGQTWKAGPMLIQCRPSGAGKVGCKMWIDQIYVGSTSANAQTLATNQGAVVKAMGSSFVSRQATIKVADGYGNLEKIIQAPFVLVAKFHANTNPEPKWIADEIWISDADFTHANDQASVKQAGDKCTELEGVVGPCG
jgi:hypothetical protein